MPIFLNVNTAGPVGGGGINIPVLDIRLLPKKGNSYTVGANHMILSLCRTGTISLLVSISAIPSHALWTQIGLAGKEVPALVMRKAFGDTMLIAGTRNDGVWYQSGSGGQFRLLDNIGSTVMSPFLAGLRALYIQNNEPRLWAGGDSGLAYYRFTSGLPPLWTKVESVPGITVTDITGKGDTLFCCTTADVYRSFNGGTTWAACSTRKILPPLGNITSFSSLEFVWGINAGSRFGGALNSWQGAMNSPDHGGTWNDLSSLCPGSGLLGEVFDLAAYRPSFSAQQRLLAVTGNGIKYVEGDLDTGCWHPFVPQLNAMTPKSMHISYFSRSLEAEFWASGDSGVYLLSNRTNPVGWARVFDKKTDCVIDNAWVDPTKWYAGTSDGVWMFPPGNVSIKPGGCKPPAQRNDNSMSAAFTMNGRRLDALKRPCVAGAVLIMQTSSYAKKKTTHLK